ncbi:hypothetical protein [Solimonas marina]|uniref:Uncharacterized protein n=1 Tax=Solimonas marina TaxID=2714601 RepID=A0A970BAR1_9GAMM|nr:hypothetical protein [Solimonas marina]NKF23631.1 hypothetical protein [Solimonas marina]
MNEVLVMPRNLAIRILHAAQIAQPESIRGAVYARGGEPASFVQGDDAAARGDGLWAVLWSHPQAEAVPAASELKVGLLSLVVSLNIKGVLEMRAWRLVDGAAQEQVLTIRD